MKFDLAVELRQGVGKGPARQLRRAGKVPAVLYGQGECLLLVANPDDLVKILRSHAASTSLISLSSQWSQRQIQAHRSSAGLSGRSGHRRSASCRPVRSSDG